MEKKIYNQPAIEVKDLKAMSIICASFTNGGNSGEDPIDGD